MSSAFPLSAVNRSWGTREMIERTEASRLFSSLQYHYPLLHVSGANRDNKPSTISFSKISSIHLHFMFSNLEAFQLIEWLSFRINMQQFSLASYTSKNECQFEKIKDNEFTHIQLLALAFTHRSAANLLQAECTP